jgi:hypothetical protein
VRSVLVVVALVGREDLAWVGFSLVEDLASDGADDAFGLCGEELAPGGAAATWRWIDACWVQDLPDGRGGDPVTESGQLALDPPMSPPLVQQGHDHLNMLSAQKRFAAALR